MSLAIHAYPLKYKETIIGVGLGDDKLGITNQVAPGYPLLRHAGEPELLATKYLKVALQGMNSLRLIPMSIKTGKCLVVMRT